MKYLKEFWEKCGEEKFSAKVMLIITTLLTLHIGICSEMIKIVADIEPVPFKRVMGGYHRYNDKRYTEYKQLLGYFAIQAMQGCEPLTGAIKLSADFYKPKPKSITSRNYGDVDNFLKAVMDALTGICYVDDSQVIEVHARKFFGQPKVIIELEESICSE